MRFLPLLAVSISAAPVLFTASEADAHIRLMSPAPRYSDQKSGPCGRALNDVRGGTITTFEPGQTINVIWQETIGHPGHFRISFDADGQDDFGDPSSYTDTYSNPAVLLDDIPDQSGTQIYSIEITLPDIECENCTLQVIQVMTDKPPYTVGGNDIYYQCADIILRRGGPPADAGVAPDANVVIDAGGAGPDAGGASPDAGAPGVDLGVSVPGADAGDTPNEEDSGCSASGGRFSNMTWLFLLAILFVWRRSRSLG